MRTPLLAALLLVTLVAGCTKTIVCPKSETACGDHCVTLDRDAANCGACGRACGTLEVCDAGACGCAPDVATCGGGACADLRIDPQNCGTCGTACGGATPLCDGDAGGCVAAGACSPGDSVCGASCVDLQASPSHCGACEHACAPGQACIAGTCGAAVLAACYWTNEVKPLTRSLRYGGPVISLGTARPSRLALAGDTLLVASGQPQASLSLVPLAGGATKTVALPGWDLEGVRVHGGAVLVSNAAVGTLEVLSLDGTVLDEIPMPGQQDYPNPIGFAVSGTDAYVALNAQQTIAKIDLSQLATCTAPDPSPPACDQGACAAGRRCISGTCRLECGTLSGTIDLFTVEGAVDGVGLPLPSAVAVAGSKVFVTLSNLEWSHVVCDGFEYDWWSRPAGPGRLAMIDPDAADTVSIVNLGDGCKSPSDVVARGTSLFVSCGAYCFPDVAPGALVEVDLSTGTPVVGAPIALGDVVAGQIAFCGTDGYVTDQRKTGAVVRFDPYTGIAGAPVVLCGADANDNALVSDVVCNE